MVAADRLRECFQRWVDNRLILNALCSLNCVSQLERISALATENPEVPNVKIGKPSDFFDSVAAKTRHGRDLATWRGELYFELHRGVSCSALL